MEASGHVMWGKASPAASMVCQLRERKGLFCLTGTIKGAGGTDALKDALFRRNTTWAESCLKEILSWSSTSTKKKKSPLQVVSIKL